MEHEYYAGLSLGIMAVYAIKKFGPATAAYLDKEVGVWYYYYLTCPILF